MENQLREATKVVQFGQRKVRPRVLVSDAKQHIRAFLMEVLEELGFVTNECAQVSELSSVLDTQFPDLVVFGLSAGGIETCEMLNVLAIKEFRGKVLLLGPPRFSHGGGCSQTGSGARPCDVAHSRDAF